MVAPLQAKGKFRLALVGHLGRALPLPEDLLVPTGGEGERSPGPWMHVQGSPHRVSTLIHMPVDVGVGASSWD